MAETEQAINTVAPLRNVAALAALIDRVQARAFNLPGMGAFYGPSGFVKTTAALYATNRFRAVTVQVKSSWTRKKLCEAIIHEMGLAPLRTVADMVDQISEQMALTDVPLIIDEADFLVSRKMIEIVRDIYEGSQAPVILIGEELLPQKLSAWERVHGQILDWVAAEPGDMSDLNHLAKLYAPGIEIDPALKSRLLQSSHASIRRICVNLDRVAEFAAVRGLHRVTMNDWAEAGRDFFTGIAPAPRRNLVAMKGGAA